MAALTEVATKHKERKPLLYAATADNVDAMGELAKKLDMTVVAEGVDTEEQIPLLRELDCDQIQG